MRYGRKLAFLSILSVLIFGFSFQVSAKVDAYLVKDASGVAYQYDLDNLVSDFLNFKMGKPSPLYNTFNSKLSNGGEFYAFHDDSAKYVDYLKVRDEFIKAKLSGNTFVVDNYCAATTTESIENLISTAKVVILKTDGTIAMEDMVLTDNFEVISIE